MLFLAESKEVGGETDLGFDLLLAITEVIVGDDRDNHSAFIAASHLESDPVIVELLLVVPAHAVAPLALGGDIPVWQTKLFLGDLDQVRRENDAAGVPGPVLGVQPGIVLRQKGLPAFPKMLSTKSRLLTRLPGARNRISIDFSGMNPGTSGLTIGRSSNETKHSACFSCAEVNGNRSNSGGGAKASCSSRPATRFGTLTLSSGTGNPPSAI